MKMNNCHVAQRGFDFDPSILDEIEYQIVLKQNLHANNKHIK